MIKIFWWRHGQELWRHNFFQNTPILRRPGVAIFAGIIKIVTMFIKKIKKKKKTQKKLEEL